MVPRGGPIRRERIRTHEVRPQGGVACRYTRYSSGREATLISIHRDVASQSKPPTRGFSIRVYRLYLIEITI